LFPPTHHRSGLVGAPKNPNRKACFHLYYSYVTCATRSTHRVAAPPANADREGLSNHRANQVWAMDITYVPVGNGYMYLFAIIDLYSRYIVGWSLSNTMLLHGAKNALRWLYINMGSQK